MFKIGDFSKLSQVTVKALRYYDDLGLLKPAQVDRFTGYRYYTVDQLPRLNRILALKDLGFSLEQIGNLLAGDLPASQIRGMLQMKQAEIEHHIEHERARLARVEARLKLIEQEGKMPEYEIVLKKVEAMKIAAARDVIPSYAHVGELLSAVFGHIGRHGAAPGGPPICIYYDAGYREKDTDVEAAVPVSTDLPGDEQVQVRELPAVDAVASVIHKGSYEAIHTAYAALMAWIEENGYRIVGPNREIYLRGPGQGEPDTYVTELQIPVEKA
jgi:effector-binding domain-containing protein